MEAAARSIDPVFLNSPQFESDPLGERLGMRVLLKVETINPIRCFKGRGTDYLVSTLPKDTPMLVTASAGNFGQGMAYAARRRGFKLVVFAAESANPLKVERMRGLGAEVRMSGSDFDEAKDRAREFARQTGTCFIEDGREPAIAEGAGTIAGELLRSKERIEFALVPLGNGALLAGMGRWLKEFSPSTRVIGVCAAGAPSMAFSLRDGAAQSTESISTIADGIGVRVPVPEALDDLDSVVDEVVLVDDDTMLQAMRLLFQDHGLVIEPAGAAGLAAAVAFRERFRGARIATPLCGGNLTQEQIRNWLL